jgi:hypothetical protein
MVRLRRRHAVGVFASTAIALIVAAGTASAHVVEHAGDYTLEIGWQHEPTFVGETNGIQVTIHDGADKPVTDLGADDIKVVVSTGTEQSQPLTFEPAFDAEEGEGPLGEYDAAILPTAPGDYSFHITGSVHGTAVDVTVASGPDTFNSVEGTSDLQFPTKLPALGEIVTRLDRMDARIATPAATPAPAPAGPTAADATASHASQAADDAQAAADRALLVGGGLGLAGLLFGLLGLAIALRSMRTRTT